MRALALLFMVDRRDRTDWLHQPEPRKSLIPEQWFTWLSIVEFLLAHRPSRHAKTHEATFQDREKWPRARAKQPGCDDVLPEQTTLLGIEHDRILLKLFDQGLQRDVWRKWACAVAERVPVKLENAFLKLVGGLLSDGPGSLLHGSSLLTLSGLCAI